MGLPCPPPQANGSAQFDLRNPVNCLALATGLLTAYYKAISGTQRVTVRFQERWTEYGKANADQLRDEYMVLYRSCPAVSQNGMPDLSLANRVRRGPPAEGFFVFPRM